MKLKVKLLNLKKLKILNIININKEKGIKIKELFIIIFIYTKDILLVGKKDLSWRLVGDFRKRIK